MALLFGGNVQVNGIASQSAYGTRMQDLIIRIKEDLGVDELLLAIEDSQRIASDKVATYLALYKKKVGEAVGKADDAALRKAADLVAKLDKAFDGKTKPDDNERRSGKNVEKIVTLTWKNTYELEMEDVNAMMPLAQQIVSKYMSNFNVRPKMT